MDKRKNALKKGIDLEEARRKREDNVIELRKTKREENLLKKRQTFAAPQYALEDSNKQATGAQRVRAGRTGSAFSLGVLGMLTYAGTTVDAIPAPCQLKPAWPLQQLIPRNSNMQLLIYPPGSPRPLPAAHAAG